MERPATRLPPVDFCVAGLFPHHNRMTHELYLDLMERCPTDWIYDGADERARRRAETGRRSHPMIGLKRLRHLRTCVETVLADGVPGDLIETGVWRGGATIFMRAILKAHAVTDRTVWVADSFAGLPALDVDHFPHDQGITLHRFSQLAVPLERMPGNFRALWPARRASQVPEGMVPRHLANRTHRTARRAQARRRPL